MVDFAPIQWEHGEYNDTEREKSKNGTIQKIYLNGWTILNGRVKCIAWIQCICNVNVSSEMVSFVLLLPVVVVIIFCCWGALNASASVFNNKWAEKVSEMVEKAKCTSRWWQQFSSQDKLTSNFRLIWAYKRI